MLTEGLIDGVEDHLFESESFATILKTLARLNRSDELGTSVPLMQTKGFQTLYETQIYDNETISLRAG